MAVNPTEPKTNCLNMCNPISNDSCPSEIVYFRRSIPIRFFDVSRFIPLPTGSNAEADESVPISLGEARLAQFRFGAAIDVQLQQRWDLAQVFVGDLASTLALAPAEKVTLTIRKTQRERVERKSVESKESMSSYESSTHDKEVMSATRTSRKSRKWTVDGDGNISLGGDKVGGSLGLGFNISDVFERTTEESVQSIREATEKSSKQLTLVNKVEVSTSEETILVESQRRTIKNPYRDRSLMINVYELRKRYNVMYSLHRLKLALFLEVERIDFDRDFARRNLNFLEQHLIEQQIINEYSRLIRDSDQNLDNEYNPAIRLRVDVALRQLFQSYNIFGFEDDEPNTGLVESFQVLSWQTSALEDILEIQGGSLFTGLIYFYSIWRGLDSVNLRLRIPLSANAGNFHEIYFDSVNEFGDFKVDLAIALSQFLSDQLGTLEAGAIGDMFDTNNRTEVLRRINGFVAFISGLVEPMRGEDEARRQARNRMNTLEHRLVEHLRSYSTFYTSRYLEYISENMDNYEFIEVIKMLLEGLPNNELPSMEILSRVFSFENGFVDGNSFVIQGYESSPPEDIGQIIAGFGEAIGEEFEFDTNIDIAATDSIELPMDGTYIEANGGNCVLPGVPECPECVSFKFPLDPQQNND